MHQHDIVEWNFRYKNRRTCLGTPQKRRIRTSHTTTSSNPKFYTTANDAWFSTTYAIWLPTARIFAWISSVSHVQPALPHFQSALLSTTTTTTSIVNSVDSTSLQCHLCHCWKDPINSPANVVKHKRCHTHAKFANWCGRNAKWKRAKGPQFGRWIRKLLTSYRSKRNKYVVDESLF